MKVLITLPLLCAVLTASALQQLENDDIIEAVNSAQTTWTAGRNFDTSLSKHYITRLLGLRRREGKSILPLRTADDYKHIPDAKIPKAFDARKKWPKCDGIKTVRDQGDCGSCWAVSAAAAFTDRLCIASGGKFNVQLSAEELVTCCSSCGYGCFGGYDDAAWQYFQDNGIVTGGDYGSKEGCQPYKLQPCEHHTTGPRPNCSDLGEPATPKCEQKCVKSYKKAFKKDHHKVSSTFMLNDPKSIQKELMTNGPVEAGFDVYYDFLSYKKGVYQHETGDYAGGHAVKIIGWGVEKKTPYWLVANSWNSDWGDKGFFKIKRGNNECSFESDISGGTPIV